MKRRFWILFIGLVGFAGLFAACDEAAEYRKCNPDCVDRCTREWQDCTQDSNVCQSRFDACIQTCKCSNEEGDADSGDGSRTDDCYPMCET